MKLTRKGKIVFGTFFTVMFLLVQGVVGIPQASSPTKAEAQALEQEAQENVLNKYVNADELTDSQLIELLQAVGFKGQDLKEAWAIAKKESRGNPISHNGNRDTGDNSYGLFQINMVGTLGPERRDKFNLASNAELFNPVVNAKIAYHMSNGGKDWSAWKGLKTKAVKFWLAEFPKVQKSQPKQKPQQKQAHNGSPLRNEGVFFLCYTQTRKGGVNGKAP